MVSIQGNNVLYKGRKARIVVSNDITERINYIKAIEDHNEKLKEISWMQSHIIRAPLCRILGLIPLMENDDLSSTELKEIKEYIKLSALELDKVIHDITDKISVD